MKRLPGKIDQPGITVFTRLMRAHQVSSRELAELCGVSKGVILRVAQGQEPGVRLGIKLAHFFQVRVEDLWGQ